MLICLFFPLSLFQTKMVSHGWLSFSIKLCGFRNAAKIKRVFHAVRLALLTVDTVMLILSVLGLLLSVLCYQHVVHI